MCETQTLNQEVEIEETITEVEATEAWFDARTHNGTITIHNPATGGHRTFQIRTQKDDASFAPGARVVALLTGPNNEDDYQPFAFAIPEHGVSVWKTKRFSGSWIKFAQMLNNPEAWIGKHGLEYLFEGKCRCCNRKLTTPESIKNGIGPVCATK